MKSPEAAIEHPSPATDAMPARQARWLWIAYPLAMLGLLAVWGGLLTVGIGRQIAELVPDPRAAAGTLGAVMSAGAAIALVAQPILGGLSDRTRDNAIGRRNVWVLGGGLASALVLLLMAANNSLAGLALLFGLVMLPMSGLQAALTTVIPERIPAEQQGRMSGIIGSVTLLGILVGVAVEGTAPSAQAGYVRLAALVAASATLFALTTREGARAPVRSAPGLLGMFRGVPRPREAPAFWWTFASRFLMILGYNLVAGFNLYLLKNHLHVGGGSAAAAAAELTKVMGLSSAMLFLFSIVGGLICDRTGRIRVFIVAASLMFVPAAAVLIGWQTLPAFYLAQAIMGAAFGTYMAVDVVLMARVLPHTGNAGRDLGVLNIANSGPQAIGPVIAGSVVALTANYSILFVAMAALAILAALCVRFIRGVS